MAGKRYRGGISMFQLMRMFPNEASAREWFERIFWQEGRFCPRCGSGETYEVKSGKPMPYRCPGCKTYFSVRTGTILESSRLPLLKWVFAIYLLSTSLKGISSLRLAREIAVTQKTAWYLLQRLRDVWGPDPGMLVGPVEVDETYIGGKERNKHYKDKLRIGRGTAGKQPVIGVMERESGEVRAHPIPGTNRAILPVEVRSMVLPGSTLYTDEHSGYDPLYKDYDRHVVRHGRLQYVDGPAHTNHMESFWSMMKRGYMGTYHWWSLKHLPRYVHEFAWRHNHREQDTEEQMTRTAEAMVGHHLSYSDLTSN